jgi:RimJ/RimL family protein N-acetyltransferase
LSPSLELSTSWINKQIERYQAQGLGLLAVIERESGQLVGMAGIIPRNIKNKDYFEIAYSMKPSFQRKGYATEAAMMMKQFGVMNNLSSSFISVIHPENYSSIRVAEKNGMSYKFDAEYLSMSVQVYGD